MPPRAIIIGPPELCRRVEQQLQVLVEPPEVVGRVVTTQPADPGPGSARLEDLESVIDRLRPNLALVSLPAVMSDAVTTIRTTLRRRGVADRFLPPLEDLVAGVGPRTHLEVDLESLLDRPPRLIEEPAIASVISGRTVLITGAGGTIGGELARLAARFAPERLVLVERSENALFEIDRQIARRHPDLPRSTVLHDVVEQRETMRLFGELSPDVVFHAAAHKHVPMMEDHPAAAVDNNLFGTRAVAGAADAVGAERFVMISTDKAVNPTSVMGATKRLAELSVQDLNQRTSTACSVVRFGNVLGSSGSVLETWTRQIAEGGPITVTDPEMTRYFMTIPEAAALVMQSAALVDRGQGRGEVFLLDMGDPVRIVDLATRFVQAHGLAVREAGRETPNGVDVVFTGRRPGEKLHEDLAFDAEAMQRTSHPDINIWMLPAPDRRYVERLVRALDPSRRPQDATALARLVRDLAGAETEPVVA